uniref:Uncharacterized protein n=1 Tax=Sphaerodactylus townsendi TaxID=933632 RepID=A0ACB8EZR3_9SAUR
MRSVLERNSTQYSDPLLGSQEKDGRKQASKEKRSRAVRKVQSRVTARTQSVRPTDKERCLQWGLGQEVTLMGRIFDSKLKSFPSLHLPAAPFFCSEHVLLS